MSKKVAVVTGSNKGIGFAIVEALCKKFDGDVYLTSRDTARGVEALAKLHDLGLKPKFHLLDIENKESIEKLGEHLKSEYGGLDILVNNAAMAYKHDSAVPNEEQAENTVKVNVLALMDVCNCLFPLLKAHSRVVNVSSSVGMLRHLPNPELKRRFTSTDLSVDGIKTLMSEFVNDTRQGVQKQNGWPGSNYSLSKVAVTALSIVQQREFDKDAREDLIVNAVHPGYVDTDMTSHKGPLTIQEGAEAPVWAALLEANVKEPKGQMIWNDKRIVNWYDNLPVA